MIIQPKTFGFICTTAHPSGCETNVIEQISRVKSDGLIKNGPKNVLVIGASTGYGLASRITAAFGSNAATLGVFLEKPAKQKRSGSAGWYNSYAFEKAAHAEGLYAKSIMGDAFSDEVRAKTIETIKQDMEKIDLVIYSLASPVRKLPSSGETIWSALKPIGQPYKTRSIDLSSHEIIDVEVEPATEQEIKDTVSVLGGEDWELWINALKEAEVLADGVQTISYTYIGTEITWPIYWHGALGKAKADMDRVALSLHNSLKDINGSAHMAVLKSVITQASAAIPAMPLYLSMAYKLMKERNTHEDSIEQINRMFRTQLFNDSKMVLDDQSRIRMDDWELDEELQNNIKELGPKITSDNLLELTDYQGYKDDFMKLFGFGIANIDYDADIESQVDFKPITL